MMTWLKRLFCRHDWKPITMVPGFSSDPIFNRPDEIIYKCTKCGKRKSEFE